PVTDNLFANLVVETPLVPEEALGHFRGEDPNGNWVLTIADTALADVGTLSTWTLTIVTFTAPPIETTTSFPSTDTPLPINDLATTTSTLAVSGLDTYICDVDVNTSITHTWNADLNMTLTSPGATASTMSTANGGSNDNVFNGTLWDDNAGATNPPGPVTDNLFANLVVETPLCFEEALGAFIGQDPNGNWVYTITDTALADVGTLSTWSLDITTCTCVQPDTDLEVTKSGAPGAGSQIIWTITVTNNGPDDATGVVVTDPLAACTVFVGDDCGGANVPPWTWIIGALANGASETCNVTVDASACPVGSVSNTASATGNENDPTPANNTSTAAIGVGSVLEIPTLGRAGLVLLLLAITLGALVILRRRG
ncbi:MAG: proprotein convertase P-domain-containing protein, partial [Candidatus Rokuibacteriota bacterium]